MYLTLRYRATSSSLTDLRLGQVRCAVLPSSIASTGNEEAQRIPVKPSVMNGTGSASQPGTSKVGTKVSYLSIHISQTVSTAPHVCLQFALPCAYFQLISERDFLLSPTALEPPYPLNGNGFFWSSAHLIQALAPPGQRWGGRVDKCMVFHRFCLPAPNLRAWINEHGPSPAHCFSDFALFHDMSPSPLP